VNFVSSFLHRHEEVRAAHQGARGFAVVAEDAHGLLDRVRLLDEKLHSSTPSG
jgi:hypothetical protein